MITLVKQTMYVPSMKHLQPEIHRYLLALRAHHCSLHLQTLKTDRFNVRGSPEMVKFYIQISTISSSGQIY